ncbi:MAG: ATP phosphoribosyltransferase regulatory subunit [Candidatus Shikimatogenerans bostrichidophilus]|nr:MAG: ATP phosphoribosyltransferase regulatory subunit [Candidatus Shikimatogenerans bostrichidophilus]
MDIFKKIKGTIDLYNNDYLLVNKIIKRIKKLLDLYGYTPIITPSIENKKILKKNILNNKKIIYYINNNKFLIYDLTIPLIRFLKDNYNNIIFPFKRYQIQKVWRGENPQNYRYREFYQLDIDIISFKKDNNYYPELELITLCDKIFKKIKIKGIFNFNNKNILYGLCQIFNVKKNNWENFLRLLDKINKLNINKILILLIKKNIIKKKYKDIFLKLYKINNLTKNKKKIIYFKNFFFKYKNKNGINGIKFLIKIYKKILKINFINLNININFLLSRGLNYYKTIIFEIYKKSNNKLISLLGGGRYDNYIKINKKKTYYIGMSLGIYRIYNFFKSNKKLFVLSKKQIYLLFINLNIEYNIYNKYTNILRKYNIKTEIFPYYEKVKKQIKYANKKNINLLIFLGKNEIKNNIIKLKKINENKEYIFKNIRKLILYLKKL